MVGYYTPIAHASLNTGYIGIFAASNYSSESIRFQRRARKKLLKPRDGDDIQIIT